MTCAGCDAPASAHRWWVIEGDDHERRVVEADSESEALDAVAADFEAQYGAPYSVDLLVVKGSFLDEDVAELWAESHGL